MDQGFAMRNDSVFAHCLLLPLVGDTEDAKGFSTDELLVLRKRFIISVNFFSNVTSLVLFSFICGFLFVLFCCIYENEVA
jgi:hypothetical protein